jgi:hypothetical protein
MPDLPKHDKPALPIEFLTPSPRLTPWAAWCLAFGFGSFCLGIITAIPAVIFGVVALLKIKNAPRRHEGKAVAVTGLILAGVGALVGTFILAALALPVLSYPREKAMRDECENNVRLLAAAAARYSEQHNGALPRTLDDLAPFLPKPLSEIKCPSAHPQQRDSYELINAGENVRGKIPGTVPVVRDAAPNHRIGADRARIVGYLDGRAPLVQEPRK